MLILNNIYNSVLTFDENQDYTDDNTNKYAIQITEGKSDFSWFTINPFDFAAADDGSGVFKFNTDAITKEFINQYKGKLQLEKDNTNEIIVTSLKEHITGTDKKLQAFNWKGKDLDKKISALGAIRQEYVDIKSEIGYDIYTQDRNELNTQLIAKIAKIDGLIQTQYDRKTVITADNAYS